MRTPTLLYLEDCEDDVFFLRRALGALGHRVSLCHKDNTTDALRFLHKKEAMGEDLPDLLLVDLNMPGEDGRSFLKKVQTKASLRGLPVLAWSNSSSRSDVRFCTRNGARAYHVKPPNYESLVKTLDRLLTYWLETVETA